MNSVPATAGIENKKTKKKKRKTNRGHRPLLQGNEMKPGTIVIPATNRAR